MTKSPIVLVGVGEMGAVFARGFMRLGHPVFPVTRNQNMTEVAESVPEPEMVLIAVGEAALPDMLASLPETWKSRVALLQNELLPNDYSHLPDVTVISVWFEKKKGQDSKVIIPSPCLGPKAQLLVEALGSIDIAARVVANEQELLNELVIKNLYILTSNIAGLRVGGNVGELWSEHQDFARDVVKDIVALQEAMTGKTFDQEVLIEGMINAFNGDTEHKCMGRSAPARLARALDNAEKLGVACPTLQSISDEQAN